MPDKAAHDAAAQRAKLTMQLLYDAQNDDCLPWSVTAAFYTAVHLVEGLFAQDPIAVRRHSSDHNERHKTLKFKYSSIWKAYGPMYNASLVARYLSHGGNVYPDFTTYLDRNAVKNTIIDGYLNDVETLVQARLRIVSPPPLAPAPSP